MFGWAAPRVFPFQPEWSTTRAEARGIALELFRDLGEPVEDPYVVVRQVGQSRLEYLLQQATRRSGVGARKDHPARRHVLAWGISVYANDALQGEWTYQGVIGFDGEPLALERRFPPTEPGEAIERAEARRLAEATLARYGSDLDVFGDPQVRTQQLAERVDTMVRFPWRDLSLGEGVQAGLEVNIAGSRLAGFSLFIDGAESAALNTALQPVIFIQELRFLVLFILLPLLAIPFLRRYHAGEVGVRRGLVLLMIVLGAGSFLFAVSARGFTEGWSFGALSRSQITLVAGLQFILVYGLPLSLAVFCSWSVGESWSRERWSGKLAAFDSLLHADLANSTVARSTLRGTAAGLVLAAVTAGGVVALGRLGARPLLSMHMGPWWNDAPWLGFAMLAFIIVHMLFGELFGRLFLLPLAVGRLGRWLGGGIVAIATGLLMWSGSFVILPARWMLLDSLLYSSLAVMVFLLCDLLTVVLMGMVSWVLLAALPMLLAAAPAIQLQGWIGVLGAALPMLLSVRHLGSAREFQYRYEDIPAHVRRIAQRERQKLELETARSIQSSILPELPPQLQGVPIAHAYLPATEVGGDFYDVLALDDGRLALAVGDVAGHGASSGLVMAMAKSALAVQTTVDPEVESVFATLNRTVHQSARQRLLTTLCYAVLDPTERQMLYASAGHLFPYRVTVEGQVFALESVAYPLGVRPTLAVQSRSERLAAGDLVVLFSDGVVEARRAGSDELFGFARLEEVLRRQAGASPEQAREAILEAVEAFRGKAPRDDDLTLLIARIP